MSINGILFIVYLINSFFAARSFQNNRFFYYLYVLAVVDPLFVGVRKIFAINFSNSDYQSIVSLLILLTFPSNKLRTKLFLGVGVLLSLIHFDLELIFMLISNILIFVFIITELTEILLTELKENDKAEVGIYYLLLISEALLNTTTILLHFESVYLHVRLYPVILSINILILFLLAIWGPKKKINLGFLGRIIANYKSDYKLPYFIKFSKAENPANYNSAHHTSSMKNTSADEPINHNPFTTINHGLTRKEQEVLSLLSKGFTNQEIADLLHIDKRTIENHLQHIKEKLGYRTMHELRKFALTLQQKTYTPKNE